jgi:hypothetical protein
MRRNWFRVGFVKGYEILSWRDGYAFCYDTTRHSKEKFRPTMINLINYMEQEMMDRKKAKDFIADLNQKLHDASTNNRKK